MSANKSAGRKKLKDDLAREDEARLREGARIALKQKRVQARLGKKTTVDQRGNEVDDEEVFQFLQSAMRSTRPVRLTGKFAPGVIYRGTSKDLNKQVSNLIIGDEEEGPLTVWVPDWKHTRDKLKTLAWLMVMQEQGDRVRALSLNLGPEVIAMARRSQMLNGVGLARFLRDRINRHLRVALKPFGLDVPEFFIWVEAWDEGHAHVHGALIVPDHSEPIRLMRAVRAALKAAGGRWNPNEHERQVMLKKMHDPAGWGRYLSKWRHLTRLRVQDENTVAASGGLRSRAAAWYREARASGRVIYSPS